MKQLTARVSGQAQKLGNGNFVTGKVVRRGDSVHAHHSAQGDWRTRSNAQPLTVTRTRG